MPAHVIPGPAIESAILHVGSVVGNEIIAEFVALVDRGPNFPGFRIERQAYWVAQSRGENAEAGTVRVVLKNVGAMELSLVFIRIIDV